MIFIFEGFSNRGPKNATIFKCGIVKFNGFPVGDRKCKDFQAWGSNIEGFSGPGSKNSRVFGPRTLNSRIFACHRDEGF